MTTMKQLTDKLATEGGCIVASADCDIIELADARARGDFEDAQKPPKPADTRPSLVERLRTEADLCRNETADDVAALLDEAADEIQRYNNK